VSALINVTNLAIPKFEPDQAGIILKADGSFLIWNTFKNPSNPTELQTQQMSQLLGFSAALQLPAVMDVLLIVANDPEIFEQTLNTGVPH
jgi:hypothetical protein